MQKSNIEWTEETHNFWIGCRKISEGCKNCYMYREMDRFHKNGNLIKRAQHNDFYKPLHAKDKNPTTIFVNSWSDFCIDFPAADEWRLMAWHVIRETPQHTYIILTKRPERLPQCLPPDWNDGYENVWLGFSAENQERYDERSFHFRDVKAKVKFVSFEPLLGDISFIDTSASLSTSGYDLINGIDWIIAGGESGYTRKGPHGYRKCEIEWFEHLLEQSRKIKKPFFMKQLGTHLAKQYKCGKDVHGRELKNIPKNLQVRQYPHGV